VQYFERAVFEAHPANAPPYDVLLAQLGTFRYRAQYPADVPAPPTPAASGSLTGGPPPPPNTYQGCPATGDGGDRQLNGRKNRVDRGPWSALPLDTLLGLPWPRTTDRRDRAGWSAADTAAVAAVEGSPVQVEGYLAGVKVESTESMDCHSAADVDYHLWLVSGPAEDRSRSLVAEITPRVRADHPGWDSTRIRPLVDGHTRVRLAGWLLLDQEHPEQLGATRATLWEIHPIVDFAVQQPDGSWQALDGGATPVPPVATVPAVPPPTVTPTPAPAPLDVYAASAQVSNATPGQNVRVTVTGQLTRAGQPVAGVTMQTAWHYKTTVSACSGTTGADGMAYCTRDISRATLGYLVVVDVTFVDADGTVLARAQTGFTPH